MFSVVPIGEQQMKSKNDRFDQRTVDLIQYTIDMIQQCISCRNGEL